MVLFAAALAPGQEGTRHKPPVLRPKAIAETDPVPHKDDAADDPAIWIHPVDPEQSLILGTDKQGGLHVYEMSGANRQVVSKSCEPNNVDVVHGFKLDGTSVDLAIASTRGKAERGLKVWRIDPDSRRLQDVTEGGAIPAMTGSEPYGCCSYTSSKTGNAYAFVTSKEGRMEQLQLEARPNSLVGGRKIRTLVRKSQLEGCVADESHQTVFVGEEGHGVWKFPAEFDVPSDGRLVARVGENGLTRDVEGLALWCADAQRGYLIVSSQGNNTFKIYDREDPHSFVGTIDPAPGDYGDVQDTDGIAVTSARTSHKFPHGLFIAQDGDNGREYQNFKLYSWRDIAGTNLMTASSWSPRARR